MNQLNTNLISSEKIDPIINKARIAYHQVIIGQEEVFNSMLIALLCGGHILLEGAPGLAKTLAVRTFSKIMSLDFSRIQFTPDLLPADILGTEIYNMQKSEFSIKKGPLFSNIVLADEINRAPSKVQSALLESMQEKQITIGEKTFLLEEPYLVMATQNPIEQEGTYPLPEAQVDRFIIKMLVGYPSKEEEIQIVNRFGIDNTETDKNTSQKKDVIKKLTKAEIGNLKKKIHSIYIDEKVINYIVEIVQATRHLEDYGFEKGMVDCGVSPRGSIYLTKVAKAFALIYEKKFVTPDDVQSVASMVLAHRLVVSYEAEATGITSESIIHKLLEKIPTP